MLKTILLLSVAFVWAEATYLRCPPGFYNNNRGQCIRAYKETEGRTNSYPFNSGVRSRWSDGEGTNKKPEKKPIIDAKLMEIIENAIRRFGEETVRVVFENFEASVKENLKVAFYETTCGKETLEFDALYECSKEKFDKMTGGKETLDVDTYFNYALELFTTGGENNLDHDTLYEMFKKEFETMTGGKETVDLDTFYEIMKEEFFDMTGGKTTLDFDAYYEYALMSGKDSLVMSKSAESKPQIWNSQIYCRDGYCRKRNRCVPCYGDDDGGWDKTFAR